MAHCSTLMGQLLQLIPRHVFDHLVDTHAWQGPDVRKFTCWSHLVTVIFGQWSARKSLRDVVFSVTRQGRKLYHLGLSEVKRSTLANANQQRPAPLGSRRRLAASLLFQNEDTTNYQKRNDQAAKYLDRYGEILTIMGKGGILRDDLPNPVCVLPIHIPELIVERLDNGAQSIYLRFGLLSTAAGGHRPDLSINKMRDKH